MALVDSRKISDARPDYTVGATRAECLNDLTSPAADRLIAGCVALLNAGQTASRVTASARPNVYLVAGSQAKQAVL
ncbi:MAG: hypothetical protein JO361_03200 [Gammaproteobacteria bacterium]|nr:hypothetical protein [Gammaproteobacteria bacterium]